MRILGIDAALSGCSAAVLADGALAAHRALAGDRGQSAVLPGLVRAVLDESGLAATELDAVAITVGPGSFTGLRAALSLGQGIALAAGIPALGVTLAEAFAQAAREPVRQLWVAIDSRRGRVFLDRAGTLAPFDLAALPDPTGPIALAGDAAVAVACRLLARGADVKLTELRRPDAAWVAAVGARRLAGALPPLAATPLYVDAPEASLPRGGLRSPPAGS